MLNAIRKEETVALSVALTSLRKGCHLHIVPYFLQRVLRYIALTTVTSRQKSS